MVQVERKLFTVDDYYKMLDDGIIKQGERIELINGEILKMSPIRSLHSAIVDELHELLVTSLKGKFITKSQNPIRMSDFSEPEPDLSVVKFRKDKYRHRHPRPEDVLLLIEVADTSLPFDREVKMPLYAEAYIPEYWIVNLQDEQIEVFKSPLNGDFQEKAILKKGEMAHCAAIGFSLDTNEIFF